MAAFDTETTGTDPTTARIVTACVARVAAGRKSAIRSWIADPGVPIPPEATEVHGITDARVQAEGADPAEVADQVANDLVSVWAAGSPVIAMNFAYDGTVLEHELHRHGLASLRERLDDAPMLIIDPLVIDRALDRYRRGKKRLADLCIVYGLVLEGAHDACVDAIVSARVAWKMAERFPAELQRDLVELQAQQASWHVQWAEDFEAWMRANVDTEAVIERDWPLRGSPPGR